MGLYNVVLNEYKTIISCNRLIPLAYDRKYVYLYDEDDGMMNCFDVNGNNYIDIEGFEGTFQLGYNNYLLHEGKLYFDSFSLDDSSNTKSSIYAFDPINGVTQLILENSMYPMRDDNTVYAFTRSSVTGRFTRVVSIFDQNYFTYDFDDNFTKALCINKNIYLEHAVSDGIGSQLENQTTKSKIIESLDINGDVLTGFQYSKGCLSWSVRSGIGLNKPCFYDMELDKLVQFESMQASQYSITLNDDVGLVSYNNKRYKDKICIFELGEI